MNGVNLARNHGRQGVINTVVDLEPNPHMVRVEVLVNLMDNAIRHSPAGSSIDIAAGHQSHGVSVVIRDRGAGIAAERLRTAMVPFGDIDSMRVRQQRGIGLGLPMAQGFVRAHSGSLHLESEPGRGTTATLTLPATRVIKVFPK